jgi:IclR family transcriptional regulator, acetate operon repressor
LFGLLIRVALRYAVLLNEHTVGNSIVSVKPIQSVQRALRVLEAVAELQPIGVAALCRHLDLDKSSVQRVLITLDQSGWIRAAPGESTRWELSTRPLVVAHRGGGPTGLIERARPEMLALEELSGETVFLAIPDAGTIVAVYVVESHHLVRTAPHVGLVLPVEGSAAGSAILSHLSPADVAGYLSSAPTDELLRHLHETRQRGWSLGVGTVQQGAASIGAPILGIDRQPVAALVVSGPSERLSPDHFAELGDRVVAAASQLSLTRHL